MRRTNFYGFTMIEILISLSLIGLFVALPVLAYGNYLKKGRDIKRKNDVNQLSTALQQYKASVGTYPPATTNNIATDLQPLVTRGYIPSIPKDPQGGQPAVCNTATQFCYTYATTADNLNYTLSAKLEDSSVPGAIGTGSGTIASGTLLGTFTGTGTGATGGTITINATVTNGTLSGTYSGPVTGSAAGTITGSISGTVAGNATGNVTGTATVTGSVTGTSFSGTFSSLSVTGTTVAFYQATPIGTATTGTVSGGSSPPTSAPKPSNTLAPSNSPIPTVTPSPSRSPTPSRTPTPTPSTIPPSTWTRQFGGTVSDGINAMRQATDGGYIMAGYTNNYGGGSSDIYLVKLNPNTTTIDWTKTIGGTLVDKANSVEVTSDGGYIVAGYTASYGAGGNDFYIVKLDSTGAITWSKVLGGTNNDVASSVKQTADGGYIVVGNTNSFGLANNSTYLVKLTSAGVISWSKILSTQNEFAATSVVQTSDGGYALGGYAGPSTNYELMVAKTDSSGTIVWQRLIGGASQDFGVAIIQASDTNLVAVGYEQSFGAGNNDAYLVKYDISGNLLFKKTYGTANHEYARDLWETSDGGYIMAGQTGTTSPQYSGYLVKTDANGGVQWSKTYVGSTTATNFRSIRQLSDGSYIVGGENIDVSGYSHFYAMKTSSSGGITGCAEVTNNNVPTPGSNGLTSIPLPTTATAGLTAMPTIPVSSGGSLTQRCN